MDLLKALIPRVKTEAMRDCVEKLSALSDLLYKSRDDNRSEYRSSVVSEKTRTDSLVADNKVFERVVALEAKIIGVLDAINKRLDIHDASIKHLALDVQNCKLEPDEITDGSPSNRETNGAELHNLHEALAGYGAKLDRVIENMANDETNKWADFVKKSAKAKRTRAPVQTKVSAAVPTTQITA